MRSSHLAILLLTATPVVVSAQWVRPGDRVRVTAPGINQYDGTIQALTRDTITVDTLRIPIGGIERLDVHRGKKGNAGTGYVIGTFSGMMIGILIGEATVSDDEFLSGTTRAGVMIGGMLGGGLIGAVTGAFIKTDKWEEVPLGLRVSLAPQRDGRFALGLSMRF